MECSICMNLLSEAPDPLSVNPPPAKKRKSKSTTTATTESMTISTPCGHIFHRACLKGWLKGTTGSCPKCRRNITMKSAHPLFLDFQSMDPSNKTSNPLSVLSPGGGIRTTDTVESKPVNKTSSHTDKEYFDLQERHLLLKKEYGALEEKYKHEKERADLNEAIAQSLREQNSGNVSSSHDSSNVTKIDFTNKKESSKSKSKTALKVGDRVVWIREPKNVHGKVICIWKIGDKDTALVEFDPVSHSRMESLGYKCVPLAELVLEGELEREQKCDKGKQGDKGDKDDGSYWFSSIKNLW